MSEYMCSQTSFSQRRQELRSISTWPKVRHAPSRPTQREAMTLQRTAERCHCANSSCPNSSGETMCTYCKSDCVLMFDGVAQIPFTVSVDRQLSAPELALEPCLFPLLFQVIVTIIKHLLRKLHGKRLFRGSLAAEGRRQGLQQAGKRPVSESRHGNSLGVDHEGGRGTGGVRGRRREDTRRHEPVWNRQGEEWRMTEEEHCC